MSKVSLVIVSHSEKIAEGIKELAGQMAQDTIIIPAGGTDDGRIGTSFDKVQAAVEEAQKHGDVLLLSDLGSATMTIDTVLEFVHDEEHVKAVDAPIVEGSVIAAVEADMGKSLAEVIKAAEAV